MGCSRGGGAHVTEPGFCATAIRAVSTRPPTRSTDYRILDNRRLSPCVFQGRVRSITEEDLPLVAARERLEDLLHTAAVGGRFRIENEQGQAAYLIGAADFVELDDWAAIGRYATARRTGTLEPGIPMAEAMAQLRRRIGDQGAHAAPPDGETAETA